MPRSPNKNRSNRRDKRSARPNRHRDERDGERFIARESSPPPQTPQQTKAVETLLAGIGVPPVEPFKPDAFQLEALAAIEYQDVLVTAPTGSGKTWIAREEIRRILAAGQRAWYTTPLKALTNSKYAEFSTAFGADNVGILTGDRKENTDAALIVGTTEIYRNQLFDALREGFDVKTDFVIFDEAHYLADDERGHVWEESIILSPERIRLLLLSATIGKAEEFARWMESVRGVEVRVIKAGKRPVELRTAFLSRDLQLIPLLDENKQFNRAVDAAANTKMRDQGYLRRRR